MVVLTSLLFHAKERNKYVLPSSLSLTLLPIQLVTMVHAIKCPSEPKIDDDNFFPSIWVNNIYLGTPPMYSDLK